MISRPLKSFCEIVAGIGGYVDLDYAEKQVYIPEFPNKPDGPRQLLVVGAESKNGVLKLTMLCPDGIRRFFGEYALTRLSEAKHEELLDLLDYHNERTRARLDPENR